MLRDSSSSRKADQQAVVAAIDALQAKGWDINPYTVADEAQIPCSMLYRSAQLMDLIAKGRRAAGMDFDAQNYEANQQLDLLAQRNRELESTLALIEHENQELVNQNQQAWQDGYWAAVQQLSVAPSSIQDTADDGISVNKTDVEVSEEILRDLVKHRLDREELVVDKQTESAKKMTGTQFIGTHKLNQDLPKVQKAFARTVPPDIRKACLVLGVKTEELSYETVGRAWKKEMSNPGGHPDLGGETEIAIYLNTARDTLNHFLDAQAPKLGKKFGVKERQSVKTKENDEQVDKT